MSIWSSLPGPALPAADLHEVGDNLSEVGDRERIQLDVATSTSWTDRIRLAAFEAHGLSVDVCLLLAPSTARELARELVEAADRVDAAR